MQSRLNVFVICVGSRLAFNCNYLHPRVGYPYATQDPKALHLQSRDPRPKQELFYLQLRMDLQERLAYVENQNGVLGLGTLKKIDIRE